MSDQYLHGRSQEEQLRLDTQANFLERMIHDPLDLSHVRHLLEIGVGVGAQTRLLLQKYPQLRVLGVDVSDEQIVKARENLGEIPEVSGRYELMRADAMSGPIETSHALDGAFLCWVLEHVKEPLTVLENCRMALQPGSTIVVTEVYNQSQYLHPDSPATMRYWRAFSQLQADLGGHPQIGAHLGDLLYKAGFTDIQVYPVYQHHDHRHPDRLRQMVAYFKELLRSAWTQLLELNYIEVGLWGEVEAEMNRLVEHPDAIYYYSAFQATAKS
ncbi:MAG: methyltransferase domain-containing protein [Bacteroidota bacterium]